MSDLVERCARVGFEVGVGPAGVPWEEVGGAYRELWLSIVRAVLGEADRVVGVPVIDLRLEHPGIGDFTVDQ